MTRTWLLIVLSYGILGGAARAEEQPPPRMTIGLRAGPLHDFSTSGGVGSSRARAQDDAFGAAAYADWRLWQYLRVGLAVPATINGPSPTSNAHDVGIALRLVADYPVTPRVAPFIAIEPGLAVVRLPQGEGVWWTGHAINMGAGARVRLNDRLSITVGFAFEATSFSGELIPSWPDPQVSTHGQVRAAYLGGNVGLEILIPTTARAAR